MNINIESCEGCKNLILLDDKTAKQKTFNCPICGCINAIGEDNEDDIMHGSLQITKGKVTADANKNDNSVFSVTPTLSDEEKGAIMLLQKYGWKMKFIKKK